MRTFAHQPKVTQQTTSAKPTIPGRAHFGQSREVNSILHLQRTMGNQAVQRLLQVNPDDLEARSSTNEVARFAHDFSPIPVHPRSLASIQGKLTVSSPGDIYEQEADRVAEQVMRMPELQLQRACPCGGGCPSCQEEVSVKPQLRGSTPDDASEHEADRVTDQVMNLSGRGSAPTQTASVAGATGRPNIQRLNVPGEDETHTQLHIMTKGLSGQRCDSAPSGEEEEEGNVMRKAMPGESQGVNGHVGNLLSRSRGGGRPLSDTIRTSMETRFGHDFGDVRIHTDSDAAQMTRDLHAEAFTTGRDIYFQPGKFAPHVSSGKRLLAHELTHVVQQRGNDFLGRSTSGNGVGQKYWIQRYGLKGFPPTEEAAMKAAIPIAADKVLRCSRLSTLDRVFVSQSIKDIRYDYVADLGLCGWTFPSSWYIEIGKSAFDRNVCCDLPSTIAHEVSHTHWFTEGGARKLECKCFGCSC